jgi:hypothetical protein
MAGIEIGRVVASNDQTDYVVHVHGEGDVEAPPSVLDRAFGQFVAIPAGENRLIGIVYRTQLVNPAYGDLGPRLSTETEIPIFSPDYLRETATLVGVTILGTAWADETELKYDQHTSLLSPAIDAPVFALPDDEFVAFHRPAGRLRLEYFPRLLARPSPSVPDLLRGIVDRLVEAFPDDRPRLSVIRQSITWRAAIQEG